MSDAIVRFNDTARQLPEAAPVPGDAPLRDRIIAVLRNIYDPELPVNIYDLGLIYRIDITNRDVAVVMTLTTPNCPVAGSMPAQVECAIRALEDVEKRHVDDEPTVEEIIGAFTMPLLQLLADDHDKWSHYFQLIAQINNSPDRGGELMSRFFDPLVSRFIEALRKALPDSDPADLYWSYHFLSGALTLTFAETGRINNLSGGLCKSSDMAAINERMPAFLAAGFRELCSK